MVEAAKVRRMFAGVARRYDFLNHLLSCQIDRRWRRAAVRATGASEKDFVLDVCAGTGDLTFAFARCGARAVGTDFTPEMISLARKKRENRAAPLAARTSFAIADSLSLPFPAEVFDIASVAFGIRNLSDWRAGIAEMARVVKPGGQVAILEFAQPKSRWFRGVYDLYFRKVLPAVGRMVSDDPEAYRYLPESVQRFATPEELAEEMMRRDLEGVSVQRLTGGIAALLLGRKGA